MGFRDGKLGDLFVELMVEQYLVNKYKLSLSKIELNGILICLHFRYDLDVASFKKDHCQHVKEHYQDYDTSLGNNVLVFDTEYFLRQVLNWMRRG